MPAVAKVHTLPDDIRGWLEGELKRRGYGDYVQLSELLAEKGYRISKSTLGRFGVDLKERCDALRLATETAKTIVRENPDDDGAMNDALQRLVQEKIFTLLYDLQNLKISTENFDAKDLARITRAIADITNASLRQKRWMAEGRKQQAEKVEAAIAEAKPSGGLSDAAEARIRAALLE
jgi:hypothetical protein